jgi:aldose 1-epimerase
MSTPTHGAAVVSKEAYGTTADGIAVDVYTISSEALQVKIITYGSRVIAIEAPDKAGHRDNVVLGYKDIAGYQADKSYFGALVGRYANRIAKGKFSINGESYQTPINNGENSLHGGTLSFAQKLWTAQEIPNGVAMTLISPDGDMGYPGALTVTATYTLDGTAFHVDIKAVTDKETVLNLTNHSYFNLSGEGNGTVVHNVVQIEANQYVPVNDTQIPIGEFAVVEGTPFDFRMPHVVGERIDTPGDHQLELGGGYDHTLVVRGVPGTLREAATVVDTHSGRTLTVSTTQPGVHFYTGNSLPGTYAGSNGKLIERRAGLCLETQHFADTPNHPSFPSTTLKPGETFHETTVFTFGVA